MDNGGHGLVPFRVLTLVAAVTRPALRRLTALCRKINCGGAPKATDDDHLERAYCGTMTPPVWWRPAGSQSLSDAARTAEARTAKFHIKI